MRGKRQNVAEECARQKVEGGSVSSTRHATRATSIMLRGDINAHGLESMEMGYRQQSGAMGWVRTIYGNR